MQRPPAQLDPAVLYGYLDESRPRGLRQRCHHRAHLTPAQCGIGLQLVSIILWLPRVGQACTELGGISDLLLIKIDLSPSGKANDILVYGVIRWNFERG
jgi:hypothetical protein